MEDSAPLNSQLQDSGPQASDAGSAIAPPPDAAPDPNAIAADAPNRLEAWRDAAREALEQARETVGDRAETLQSDATAAVDRAREAAAERAQQALDAAQNAGDAARDAVQERWLDRWAQNRAAAADRLQERWDGVRETADATWQTWTQPVADSLGNATERAQAGADRWAEAIAAFRTLRPRTLQAEISEFLKQWLEAHPVAAWAIVHPLWALLAIVLAIVLGLGLVGALGDLVRGGWRWVLQLPVRLAVGAVALGGWTARRLRGTAAATPSDLRNRTDDAGNLRLLRADERARIVAIVDRLERLRGDQDRLLGELSALLGSPKPPEPAPPTTKPRSRR